MFGIVMNSDDDVLNVGQVVEAWRDTNGDYRRTDVGVGH